MRDSDIVRWFAAVAWLGALAGCAAGEGDEGDEGSAALQQLSDEMNAAGDLQRERLCSECDDADPLVQNNCRDESPATETCHVEALQIDAVASQTWLECMVPHANDFAACLDENLQCGDEASWLPCTDAYAAAVEACGELPDTVNEALEACYDDD